MSSFTQYFPVAYKEYPSKHEVASDYLTSHFFAPILHLVHYELNKL